MKKVGETGSSVAACGTRYPDRCGSTRPDHSMACKALRAGSTRPAKNLRETSRSVTPGWSEINCRIVAVTLFIGPPGHTPTSGGAVLIDRLENGQEFTGCLPMGLRRYRKRKKERRADCCK